MAGFSIKTFGGISPKTPARYLQDSQAQVALNCPVFNGPLQPLPGLGATVATLTKVGAPKTIYRFGQDALSDSQYWFHWTTDVNVARAQLPNDTSEWTFFTGDGAPKATYAALALSGSNIPTVTRPLGLPAPDTAPSVTALPAVATVTIFASVVAGIDVGETVGVSLDGSSYTDVVVVTATAAGIAAQLDAISGIDAVEDDGDIVVTRTGASSTEAFSIRYQTGDRVNTAGTFTYDAALDKSDSGDANTAAYVIVVDAEIGSVASGDVITVRTSAGTHKTLTASGAFTTAASFAAALTTTQVIATAFGSCVVLTPGTEGGGSTDFIEYKRTVSSVAVTTQKVDGAEAAQPARIFITAADVAVLAGNYLAATVNAGSEVKLPIASTATVSSLTALSSFGVKSTVFGVSEPFAVIETNLVGGLAFLRLRAGDYPTELVFSELDSSSGADLPETRVYTYTNVSKESGFEFESAPAEASPQIDVRLGQSVTLSSFAAAPAGYNTTHRRIYRATSGVFLFVDEITIAASSYNDTVTAESLGEELPSLTWLPPPADLKGLINLPGGIMAGFVGRDVYFCDPYRPHAWPIQYQQSLDYPVVGLGRIDTTLIVLTTGTPYLIQGSSPDSMVVVKSELQQACVSKRSIVSAGPAVLYASPDGLVSLAPSGSRVITEQYFTRDQWQAFFKPDSIHAYMHDMKYVAFYDNGVVAGGFIYDMTTGQLVLHDVYAEAGYQDLQIDKLFLAFADRTVKVWQAGSAKSYVWRSKKFTMPKVMGLSCAQIEAEAYPVTLKFYADNTLMFTKVVADREAFRLPPTMARDWEVQVEGNTEVFSIAAAQSMEELAGV